MKSLDFIHKNAQTIHLCLQLANESGLLAAAAQNALEISANRNVSGFSFGLKCKACIANKSIIVWASNIRLHHYLHLFE